MVDFLAIIPARGGSKGVPKKNIIDFCGKPLIAHTIEAAKKSSYLNRVVVTTDCDEIADVAMAYGAEVIKRPEALATDTAKTIDAVVHVLDQVQAKHTVLLQPTSPLRQARHIDEAVKVYLEMNKSVLSVHKTKSPYLTRDTHGQPLMSGKSAQRRQDADTYYHVNGAIYINSHIDARTNFNDNEQIYIMDERFGIDIDEPLDLEIARTTAKWISSH